MIVSALLFGAAHLGRWLSSGPLVVTAVMIVNGLVAIVLGLVYVRWGIEAAILSHFAGDVVVHIVGVSREQASYITDSGVILCC